MQFTRKGIWTINSGFTRRCGDGQTAPPAAFCSICGREIYDGDVMYSLDGAAICEECLPELARREFAPMRTTGGEWRGV